jgi:hypothetical protein
MEQQEKPSNEEEKQNQEEEEFDEEDEEEKEGDKKRQEKEENKIITQNENKEQDITSVNTDKDQISEKKEEQNEVPQPKLEENTPQEKTESNDKIQNNEKNNEKNSDEQINNEENEVEQEESSSSYILKYVRKSNEPRESTYDKELIKSKKCLYMIEFKILKGKTEKYLLVYCHEIAAIYFDEIYEKKYSIKDLYKENRHFRIFDEVEEAKDIIDEILNGNATNIKKIFIDCQDNEFKLHLNISFFDKDNEVILNIPKKNITDKERIKLLPEFLKEIQIKMNHLEEDNKKLKNEYKNMGENSISGMGADDEFFGERKNKVGKGIKKKIIKK